MSVGKSRGRAGLRGDDSVADGVANQIAEGVATQLVHDIGAVGFRGPDADPEGVRDLFVALAFRKELGYLPLPLGQRGSLSWFPPAVKVALEDELRHAGGEERLVAAEGFSRVLQVPARAGVEDTDPGGGGPRLPGVRAHVRPAQ